jgi:long-subunit acyl-CoA synthetase (AMP-forming)
VVKQDNHLDEGGGITFRTKLEFSFKYEHEHKHWSGPVREVRWVLSDSGAVAVFAGDAQCAAVIRQAQMPGVEAVWALETGGIDRLARSGAQLSAEEVRQRRRAVTPAMPATIVYTSGTTGRAKGCVLSHGNLIAAIRAITGAPGIGERVLIPGPSVLLFLPRQACRCPATPCGSHPTARPGRRTGRLPGTLARPAGHPWGVRRSLVPHRWPRPDRWRRVRLPHREEELIITATGQNVDPAALEDAVREHWLIDQCVLTGDQRPCIGALITLDPGAFARWKQRQGKPAGATIGDLCGDPDLRSAVQDAVDRANSAVSRAESIKRFRILPVTFYCRSRAHPPTRSAGTTCWLPTPAMSTLSTPEAGR